MLRILSLGVCCGGTQSVSKRETSKTMILRSRELALKSFSFSFLYDIQEKKQQFKKHWKRFLSELEVFLL